MGVESIHRPKESGTCRGYGVLTFSNGSSIMSQIEGINKPGEDGKYVQFEGTFTYTNGTGRFEGIEGSGELKGRNYKATGSGGYYDFESTYYLLCTFRITRENFDYLHKWRTVMKLRYALSNTLPATFL